MTNQELEITIEPDGYVTVHVVGVKGHKCLDLTKELEDALGTVTKRTRTSEYAQHEPRPKHKVDR